MENKDKSLQSILQAKLKQRGTRKVLAKNSQETIKINTFDVARLGLAATLCGVPYSSLPKQGTRRRTIKRLPLKGGPRREESLAFVTSQRLRDTSKLADSVLEGFPCPAH